MTGFYHGDSQLSTQQLQQEVETKGAWKVPVTPGPDTSCGSQPSPAPSRPFCVE